VTGPIAPPGRGKVLTALVGSYPKPRYVYPRNGRSLLDSFGFALDRRRDEIGQAEFSRLLDRAALEAIKDQDRAGIDIVTDGEERRGHYVLHIVNRLRGVDAQNLKPISMRAGTSQQNAPRVIGKLAGFSIAFSGPTFNEFAVRVRGGDANVTVEKLADQGIYAGVAATAPGMMPKGKCDDLMIVAVTERHSKADIDKLVSALDWVQA
jgi:hypothetical protein